MIDHVDIREQFRARGLKVTPQRAAIYTVLAGTTAHPSADALFKRVKRAYPMISRNTVYYTLRVLRQAGLVREVNVGHEYARFDANMSHHHHLICIGCQTIRDLTDPKLDRTLASVVPTADFEVTGHQVEFRGYCDSCRKSSKQKSPHRLSSIVHFIHKRRKP